MKKLFLTACVALVSAFSLNAQGLTVRAEVGGNFTNIDSKIKSQELKTDMLMGLRAGLGVEFKFAPIVYAATGLNYRMGGNKDSFEIAKGLLGKEDQTTMKVRSHTLSLPINLGLRIPLGVVSVSLEGGPYLAYTLSSKGSVEGASKEVLEGLNEFFGADKDTSFDLLKKHQKQFEVGIGGSIAAEYQNYYLRLGTTWGLTNMAKEPENAIQKALNISPDDIKNHEFYLTFGLRF